MKRKLAIYLLLGGAGVFLILMLYPIVISARPKWPDISNPEKLRSACKHLVDSKISNQYTPKAHWPLEIRELKALSVKVHGELVEIRISGGGINPTWGYVVANDPQIRPPNIAGLKIWPSEFQGIFKYQTIE